MCGIWGHFAGACCAAPQPEVALRALAHRGPDGGRHVALDDGGASCLGFTRLSLVGAARQPFVDGELSAVINGELYNHDELRLLVAAPPAADESDCGVLLPCVAAWGVVGALQRLRGMFALAVVVTRGENTRDVYLARDRMGVKPLVWGRCAAGGCVAFASEAAALPAPWHLVDVAPGHCVHLRVASGGAGPPDLVADEPFLPPWTASPQADPVTGAALRAALVSAVASQLLHGGGEHDVGVFLSGGLDSSLLAAIAARLCRQRGRVLRAFTIAHTPAAPAAGGGCDPPPSADLACARRAAAFVGAQLECFTFDTPEALAALGDVIGHLESHDVALVRVAVPLFLLARKAAARGCRAVLSGEGADEVFGGYPLFRAYTAAELPAFQRELERRLGCVAASELLRVDRCTMAAGLEARVPFLDERVLALAMHGSCAARKLSHAGSGRLEKALLRDAFAGWLPDDVLNRRKEGMADGVGHGWVRELGAAACALEGVDDARQAEAALYARLFRERHPPSRAALAASRVAARNAHRPSPLSALVDGSAFIRACRSVGTDPQLGAMFSLDEARSFCDRVLGVDVAGRPPTLELLNSLIEAVLATVPFHNLALLTRPRVPPTAREVREDWLAARGGTCAYTSPAFAATLSALGYQVALVAATVRADFDHLALLVLVGSTYHYVDVGNGKRYLEAAPLGDGDTPPLGSPASFQWRVRWDGAAGVFRVIHGKRDALGGTAWDAPPSVTFDPTRLVHYEFFNEHFARARRDPGFLFFHGLRLAVFPRPDAEVAIRDAQFTLGEASVRTASAAALLALARPHVSVAVFAWLQAAVAALEERGVALWASR